MLKIRVLTGFWLNFVILDTPPPYPQPNLHAIFFKLRWHVSIFHIIDS